MKRLKFQYSSAVSNKDVVMPLSRSDIFHRFCKRIFLISALVFCLPQINTIAQYQELDYATKGYDSLSFKKLFDFEKVSNGSSPVQLIKSANLLYGITYYGGKNGNNGILYKMKTDGSEFTNFGLIFSNPHSLTLSDSVLYGTSLDLYSEDSYLYRVNINGTGYKKLHIFGDGDSPRYEIMHGGGIIYGMKYGSWSGTSYFFRIMPDGTGYKKSGSVGYFPYGKILLHEAYLYGTTSGELGSTTNFGTIYKIKADGTGFLELHRFTDAKTGAGQIAPVTLVGTTLYGATLRGGLNNKGIIFSINTDGTNFKILHNFTSEEGNNVRSKLVSSGNYLYGAANYGGTNSYGTIFKIKFDGSGFQKLHDFQGSDGSYPVDMIMSGDTIFGITSDGGLNDDGVIFRYLVNKPQNPSNERLNRIKLSYRSPLPITLSTKNNLAVDDGAFLDLDTAFSITGYMQYTHSWKVKTNSGYDIIDKTVKISADSTFYIFLTTIQGCSFSDSVTVRVKGPTDIHDKVINNQINIYPNPNRGDFQITIPGGFVDYSYNVIDITGKKLTDGNITCTTEVCLFNINLKNVKPGVYTLVINRRGVFFSQKKFIISK